MTEKAFKLTLERSTLVRSDILNTNNISLRSLPLTPLKECALK
jgi:hypothetical protein